MPPAVTRIRRLLDLLRHIYRLTAPKSIFRYLLHVWASIRQYALGGRGGNLGRDRERAEEREKQGAKELERGLPDDKTCSVARVEGEVTFAASRVPRSLQNRDMSPNSRVESFADALSRPLSRYSVTDSSRPPSIVQGPSTSYPSRPSSYAPPHGNLLTPHAYDTSNASRSTHDLHHLEAGADVHRGRTFEPMSPILSESHTRRRSRSSHISTGIATRRRSRSKASSLRSRRRLSRVSAPNVDNAVAPVLHPENSPRQRGRSPLHPESTEIGIELETASHPSGLGSTARSAPSAEGLPELLPGHIVNRYERNVIIPKKPDDYECVIPAKTLIFPRTGVPEGWVACAHPEGALYFYREHGKVYTEADITDERILDQVNGCVRRLQDTLDSDVFRLPDNASLVLEPPAYWDADGPWSYYYADHVNRTLFWLDDYELDITELDGIPYPTQMKHEIEHKYW